MAEIAYLEPQVIVDMFDYMSHDGMYQVPSYVVMNIPVLGIPMSIMVNDEVPWFREWYSDAGRQNNDYNDLVAERKEGGGT